MISARRTRLPRASIGRDRHGSNESACAIDLLTVAEVGTFLRTSRKAIYSMIERGQLPGIVRINRRVLVDREILLDWIRQKSAPSLEG
jgi:excisionase family DNA binding protein